MTILKQKFCRIAPPNPPEGGIRVLFTPLWGVGGTFFSLASTIFCRLRGGGLLAALALLGLAGQCYSSIPPLPATPDGRVLRVALLTPASGELDTVGRMLRNGIVLAFDEWNRRGGVLDHRLVWTLYDTDCTFETARQATQQVIDDGLQIIIGPLCSEAAIAAATVAEPANILMISPAATHALVTVNQRAQTRPTIFRVSYGYVWQGQSSARFARDVVGVSKVALFSRPDNSYTTALAGAFAREFMAAGGEIVYRANYKADNADFTADLRAIEQAGAELIYLPASASVAHRVAGQLNELGLSKRSPGSETGLLLLGSDAWAATELDLALMAGSYFPVHFLAEGRNQSWVESYKATYAGEPDSLSALGYDAANMVAGAIEQAGSFETAKIAGALEQGTFEAVTGRTTFDSGHNPLKPIPFLHVLDGEILHLASIEPPAK